MYEDTPNKEYIDRWLEKMRRRYDFERLKEMSSDRLHGMEFEVDSRFEIFKAGFPHQRSGLQGPSRAFASSNPNERKKSLTSAEKERLRQERLDMKHEIYRARGYRKEKKREHRSELANTAVDFANEVSQSLLTIWATVKELKPW